MRHLRYLALGIGMATLVAGIIVLLIYAVQNIPVVVAAVAVLAILYAVGGLVAASLDF